MAVYDKYREELDNTMGGCFISLFSFLLGAILLGVVLLLGGCSTPKTIIEERHDTLYVSKVQRDTVYQSKIDSTYVHDSIFIHQKGDTVFYDKWHTQFKYKTDTLYQWKEKTDTLYQTKYETITEVKEVEKKLSWFQKTRMIVGDICLIACLIMAVIWLIESKPWTRLHR